jgi:hypothetical protein
MVSQSFLKYSFLRQILISRLAYIPRLLPLAQMIMFIFSIFKLLRKVFVLTRYCK